MKFVANTIREVTRVFSYLYCLTKHTMSKVYCGKMANSERMTQRKPNKKPKPTISIKVNKIKQSVTSLETDTLYRLPDGCLYCLLSARQLYDSGSSEKGYRLLKAVDQTDKHSSSSADEHPRRLEKVELQMVPRGPKDAVDAPIGDIPDRRTFQIGDLQSDATNDVPNSAPSFPSHAAALLKAQYEKQIEMQLSFVKILMQLAETSVDDARKALVRNQQV